ncbi:MAG: GAK system CofD-like protein [Desulfovibrio sp.]
MLFFSGGTGPKELARLMAACSIPSVHLISTFDSGRSSKELRRAFAIPALGDLRNRLLALADPDKTSRAVMDFLSFRLPESGNREHLRNCLSDLCNPNNEIWLQIPPHKKIALYNGLFQFLIRMPLAFNPLNASLGNLVLAGAYLQSGRNFSFALNYFSSLIHAKGVVMPICAENLHLAAELENGNIIVGQDRLKALSHKISKLFLTVLEHRERMSFDEIACRPPLYPQAKKYLKKCSVICFPMGSFYSSIVANTLVKGVGKAIAKSLCPKIFIPNSGIDPEIPGLDISEQASILLASLKRDYPCAENDKLLNFVLIDKNNGIYPGGLGTKVLEKLSILGLNVIFCPIVDKIHPDRHDPGILLKIIRQIAGQNNDDTTTLHH